MNTKTILLQINMLLIQGTALFCLTGCSENEYTELPLDDFAGRYEIIAVTSGQALDLNNDGIASNNLYSEYSTPFHWENAVYLPVPFDFTDPYNYADFQQGRSNNINFADFRFPCQYFYEEDILRPNIAPLHAYNWGFRNMTYQLTDNGDVIITSLITSKDDEPADNMGYIRSLQRLSKDLFEVDMTLELYDFKQQKWIITPVWTVYERRAHYE